MDANRDESNIVSKCKPDFYAKKIILAPMIRENSLPFRLTCLKYGADLVYTEELIDYRLSECKRLKNKPLGTIDFVDSRGEVILRTCDQEKERLVLQLGSNNPDRALKAAKLVCDDISAIDFNFGCPKSFSLSGGMGAALLEKPDQIKALLTKCVDNLNIPVSCKIRVLPSLERTLELVKIIESCGVSAIAVHGRTKEQRSHHDNHDDYLRAIADTITVPMIANGGSNNIRSYSDIIKFKDRTNASSVMIARSAMKNPSIFKSDNVLDPIEDVIREFLKLAVKYDNFLPITKYNVQAMVSVGHFGGDFAQNLHHACDMKTVCDLFGLGDWYEKNHHIMDKSQFYDIKDVEDPDLEKSICDNLKLHELKHLTLVCDSIPYIPRLYGPETPKSQLISHANRHSKDDRPKYYVCQFKQNRFYCIVKFRGRAYINKSFTTSKKISEHASTILVCHELGFVDLSDYRTKTSSTKRNIS